MYSAGQNFVGGHTITLELYGYLGLDVYEEEGDLFFEDLSDTIIADDIFTRLLTFPNVLITGHQAFFTRNALDTRQENLPAPDDGRGPAESRCLRLPRDVFRGAPLQRKSGLAAHSVERRPAPLRPILRTSG